MKSIHKSIAAEVAINISFDKPKEFNNKPLIAPQVPVKPAKKPEKNHQIVVFFLFKVSFILFFKSWYKLVKIKNNHKTILNDDTGTWFDNTAHSATQKILGIHNHNKAFLLIHFLKRYSFDKLLNTCIILVKPSTNLKLNNNFAKGTKKTEEPNQEIVQTISEKTIKIKKMVNFELIDICFIYLWTK